MLPVSDESQDLSMLSRGTGKSKYRHKKTLKKNLLVGDAVVSIENISTVDDVMRLSISEGLLDPHDVPDMVLVPGTKGVVKEVSKGFALIDFEVGVAFCPSKFCTTKVPEEGFYKLAVQASWFQWVTRVFKFLFLVAGLGSIDVMSDVLSSVLYWKSHLFIFGAWSTMLLLATPCFMYFFLWNSGLKVRAFWKHLTTVAIWESSLLSVRTGIVGFDMVFSSLAEGCIESFSSSVLQQFSYLDGMLKGTDLSLWGWKLSGHVVLRISISSSVFLLAKTMTVFDYYGSKATWPQLLSSFIRRVGEVGVRTTSIAWFWYLLRPIDAKDHGFSSVHLPAFLAFSITGTFLIVQIWVRTSNSKGLPLWQKVIWTTFFLSGLPPKCLTAFARARFRFRLFRILELAIMAGLVMHFAEAPSEKIRHNPVLGCGFCAACVLSVLGQISESLVDCACCQQISKTGLKGDTHDYVPLRKEEEVGLQEAGVDKSPLSQAALDGDIVLIQLFGQLMDVNETDQLGNEPLSYATTTKVAHALVEAGAKIKDVDNVPIPEFGEFGQLLYSLYKSEYLEPALFPSVFARAHPKRFLASMCDECTRHALKEQSQLEKDGFDKFVDAIIPNLNDNDLKVVASSFQAGDLHLDFKENERFTDDGLGFLASGIPKETTSIYLDLSASKKVTDVGLKHLASCIPTGTANIHIDLASKHFTEDGVRAMLAAVPKAAENVYVRISSDIDEFTYSRNSLTFKLKSGDFPDDVIKAATSSIPTSALDLHLDFRGNRKARDDLLMELASAIPLGALDIYVNFASNDHFTDASVETFAASLPGSATSVHLEFRRGIANLTYTKSSSMFHSTCGNIPDGVLKVAMSQIPSTATDVRIDLNACEGEEKFTDGGLLALASAMPMGATTVIIRCKRNTNLTDVATSGLICSIPLGATQVNIEFHPDIGSYRCSKTSKHLYLECGDFSDDVVNAVVSIIAQGGREKVEVDCKASTRFTQNRILNLASAVPRDATNVHLAFKEEVGDFRIKIDSQKNAIELTSGNLSDDILIVMASAIPRDATDIKCSYANFDSCSFGKQGSFIASLPKDATNVNIASVLICRKDSTCIDLNYQSDCSDELLEATMPLITSHSHDRVSLQVKLNNKSLTNRGLKMLGTSISKGASQFHLDIKDSSLFTDDGLQMLASSLPPGVSNVKINFRCGNEPSLFTDRGLIELAEAILKYATTFHFGFPGNRKLSSDGLRTLVKLTSGWRLEKCTEEAKGLSEVVCGLEKSWASEKAAGVTSLGLDFEHHQNFSNHALNELASVPQGLTHLHLNFANTGTSGFLFEGFTNHWLKALAAAIPPEVTSMYLNFKHTEFSVDALKALEAAIPQGVETVELEENEDKYKFDTIEKKFKNAKGDYLLRNERNRRKKKIQMPSHSGSFR